ncbi:MAG: ATP-binding cassette domain-containing protein [Eubacteriaceae bacterium]|nr:ATP-binding cassette domain-containing protein [Eubacteriaceae bacterium]
MPSEIFRLQDVTKIFDSPEGKISALKDITFSIGKNDIFGVIGRSGAGKSTLVRCLNFLEKPTSGTVFFEEVDLSSLSRKQLLVARRKMGMIFQQFNLLMQKTVEKNVLFPLEISKVPQNQAKARARELLEIVGLEDKLHAYPSQLSGGQKQRVAIARALANSPDVLLCDEATSALDPATTTSILSLLKSINETLGVTIVIVTHEMGIVERYCNKMAIVDDGFLAESGDVVEVFKSPKTIAAKKLIYAQQDDSLETGALLGDGMVRVIFDGNSSYEPIIAGAVLHCNCLVNIMHAETRDIDGKAFGHMLLQLPSQGHKAVEVIRYIESKGLKVEAI